MRVCTAQTGNSVNNKINRSAAIGTTPQQSASAGAEKEIHGELISVSVVFQYLKSLLCYAQLTQVYIMFISYAPIILIIEHHHTLRT